jgi:hypothetical protein
MCCNDETCTLYSGTDFYDCLSLTVCDAAAERWMADHCTFGSTTTNPATEGPGCPWVGVWTLADVQCAGFTFLDKWASVYDSTTLRIEAEGDGCSVRYDWTSATCDGSEAWSLEPVVPAGNWGLFEGDARLTPLGPPTCTPEACEVPEGFMPADPCVTEAPDLDTVEVNIQYTADGLMAEGLLDDPQRHDCELGLRTTWAPLE